MSATSSISETPAGMSSAPDSLTEAGIWENRSSSELRPMAASISPVSSAVWGANFTVRSLRRPGPVAGS